MGFRLIHFFTSALLLSLLAGCGGAKTGAMPPKEEAVKLMDTGENAKAAAILEDSLAKHPDDDEAKLLLASSYMGMAGIDVYKIFDAFKDLIFKKSLKDQIITPHDGVADHPSLGDGAIPDQDPAKTKSEIAVAKFDKTLSTLQLALIYLDRFPQIDEEKWPLVESALATLQSMKNPAGDTFVYRVLIRLIYSKSYLVARVLRNEQLWTREWACHFKAQDFDGDLAFFTFQVRSIEADLVQGAEHGVKTLGKAHKNFSTIFDAANSSGGFQSLSQGMTFSELENSIKGVFHCNG